MPLHESSECTQELLFDNVPASYFLIGLLEIFSSAFVSVILFNRNCFPSLSRSKMVTYVLPVYLTVVIPLLILCFLIGIHCVLGVFTTSKDLLIVKWTVLRWITDGLSIFLLHPGIGMISFRRAAMIGLLWSLANGAAVIGALYGGGFQAMLYTTIVIITELIIYYNIMAFSPAKWFHRRPAAYRYSLINTFILAYQLSVIVSYLSTESDSGVTVACVVEMSFSITEYLQICSIMYAFCLDSQFWQGLYVSHEDNLNEPLRGIWDMNRQEVNLVAQSVIQLERKVVPIIPFSQLRVDTSKYFSGGTARVYRGTFQSHDIAIKFLFCMELTPDRIVDFCQEATMLNSLQHENIVTCYGVAIMPPAISLVTEYCTWGSLFDFLHATDLVCDFPTNDEEEGDENIEDESEDDEEDEGETPEQHVLNAFYYRGSSAGIGNRPRLSTNDTKDSSSTTKPISTKQQRNQISVHNKASSRHLNEANKSSTGYFSSMWRSVFGKGEKERMNKVNSKQDVNDKGDMKSPVYDNADNTGNLNAAHETPTENTVNNTQFLSRRQTMSVDRALDERTRIQLQQQTPWSLVRYLDPENHGEEVDPQDVATKLANAMSANIDDRFFSQPTGRNSMAKSVRNPKQPKSNNTRDKRILTNDMIQRTSTSMSSVSTSLRRPRFSSTASSASSNTATTNIMHQTSMGTAADTENKQGGGEEKKESHSLMVDGQKGEDEEASWHSLSISLSLVSKHHMNAAVFITPAPTMVSTDTTASAVTAGVHGPKARKASTARMHHSQHHVRSLHLSTSLYYAHQNQAHTTNRKPSKPYRGSLSWRLRDSAADDSLNSSYNSNNKAGKWKSPAAVMLTAEMGFGMGPRSSNSMNSNSVSSNRHSNSNTAAGVRTSQQSTSTSFRYNRAHLGSNTTPSKAKADQQQRQARSSTLATEDNTTPSLFKGIFQYFFSSSSTPMSAQEPGNRHRLNTASSMASNISPLPSLDEYHQNQIKQKKYELKTALLSPEDVSKQREEDILAQLSADPTSKASISKANGVPTLTNTASQRVPLTSMSLHASVQSLGHLIPVSVRFQMMRDCAAGLAYLHTRGFMHCDIKSLNFLVTHQLVVKLADLGEARQVVQSKSNALPRNPSIPLSSTILSSASSSAPISSTAEDTNNLNIASTMTVIEESDFEFEDIPVDPLSSKKRDWNHFGEETPQKRGDNNTFEEEEESLPSNINWSSPETLQRSLLRHDGNYFNNNQSAQLDIEQGRVSPNPARKRRIIVDERADVWSLAMVIYEILSGEVPFDTDECRALSFDQFLARVKAGLRPEVPAEYHKFTWLLDMMDHAWAFHAAKRSTAGQIRDILNTNMVRGGKKAQQPQPAAAPSKQQFSQQQTPPTTTNTAVGENMNVVAVADANIAVSMRAPDASVDIVPPDFEDDPVVSST